MWNAAVVSGMTHLRSSDEFPVSKPTEAFAEAHRLQPRDANTFTALRIVCGAGRQGTSSPRNPAGEAWLRGGMPPDPDDPTPKIPMPGANPTFAIPNKPLGATKQEVRR
jgi:hypothetical protein